MVFWGHTLALELRLHPVRIRAEAFRPVHAKQMPDPWPDPKSRSTLGFYNFHHRSTGVQNWGIYSLDPPRVWDTNTHGFPSNGRGRHLRHRQQQTRLQAELGADDDQHPLGARRQRCRSSTCLFGGAGSAYSKSVNKPSIAIVSDASNLPPNPVGNDVGLYTAQRIFRC